MTVSVASDRERLAMAFDDLAKKGYYCPVTFAWEVCCNSCGLRAVEEAFDEGICADLDKYVFWHAQKDDASFYDDAGGIPLPDDVVERLIDEGIEPEDDEAINDWMEQNEVFVDAALIVDRVETYNMLVHDLFLHWSGDAKEVCDALRAQGLTVEMPVSGRTCIRVLCPMSKQAMTS